MATKIVGKLLILVSSLVLIISCSNNSGTNVIGTNTADTQLESYSSKSKSANFRVSLTDAPSKNLKSVFVNVLSAEVWVSKGDKSARVVIAKNLGLVDLMTLRNGKLLTMEDFHIPEGVVVSKMRLILGDGNYSIKSDDSRCEMQTPSGQQSGIKIHLSNPVTIESETSYSLVVDFDAEKSVVVKGNGDCLLKPVLKIADFTKVDPVVVDDDGGEPDVPGDDVTGGGDSDDSNDGTSGGDTDGDGYDDGDDSGYPPIIDPDQIATKLQ
jgi:hypothetical protein